MGGRDARRLHGGGQRLLVASHLDQHLRLVVPVPDFAGLVARRSLYLYRGLLEGAEFNMRILGKMRRILERA